MPHKKNKHKNQNNESKISTTCASFFKKASDVLLSEDGFVATGLILFLYNYPPDFYHGGVTEEMAQARMALTAFSLALAIPLTIAAFEPPIESRLSPR